MKQKIKVLFIDDNDLEAEINQIVRTMQRQGKFLEHYFIDVSDNKYKEKVTNGTDKRLTTRLIIDDIEQNGLLDMDIDIVACDFNFADAYVNGYELMSDLNARAEHQKNKIRRARKMFYTGQVKNLSDKTIPDIKRFVNLKVDSIVDRPDLVRKIVRLSNIIGSEMKLETMFLNLLEPHKDKTFNNTYPPFAGKPIAHIIDEIEKELPQGIGFMKSLTEQTVAHLIKLQEE